MGAAKELELPDLPWEPWIVLIFQKTTEQCRITTVVSHITETSGKCMHIARAGLESLGDVVEPAIAIQISSDLPTYRSVHILGTHIG